MEMLKKCLNLKVLAGLAVVGVGIWMLAPNLIARALPLLFLAACPLSMALMMYAMRGTQSGTPESSPADSPAALDAKLRDLQVEQAALQAQLDTRTGEQRQAAS